MNFITETEQIKILFKSLQDMQELREIENKACMIKIETLNTRLRILDKENKELKTTLQNIAHE